MLVGFVTGVRKDEEDHSINAGNLAIKTVDRQACLSLSIA